MDFISGCGNCSDILMQSPFYLSGLSNPSCFFGILIHISSCSVSCRFLHYIHIYFLLLSICVSLSFHLHLSLLFAAVTFTLLVLSSWLISPTFYSMCSPLHFPHVHCPASGPHFPPSPFHFSLSLSFIYGNMLMGQTQVKIDFFFLLTVWNRNWIRKRSE